MSIREFPRALSNVAYKKVSKQTAHLLFSFAVLIWTGIMVTSRLADTPDVMPIVYIVIGHIFGTQTARGYPDEERPKGGGPHE